MRRRTIRQKSDSRRKTRKQRGGANWKTPDGQEHIDNWIAKIDTLPDPLKTRLLPLVKAGEANTDVLKQARLEAYLSAIEHQDELFDMAIELIKDELKILNKIEASSVEKIIENSDKIDISNEVIMSYITDVEIMIDFKKDPTIDKDLGATKLQLIRDTNEYLSSLLIFPKRLNNIFIQSLANLFVLFKKDETNRKNITKNASITRIATDQYVSNIYENARKLTSFDLRDGFYLGQGVKDFQKEMDGDVSGSFYKKLLTEINNTDPLNLQRDSPWYKRALAVFRWYTDLSDGYAGLSGGEYNRSSILQYMIRNSVLINEKDKVTAENVFEKYPTLLENFPEAEYYTMPLDDKGATLITILNIMGPEVLQFVLHLSYTLWKSDKEQQKPSA